jgi:electron transport complex protein RnfB
VSIKPDVLALIEAIDAALPQTQCGKCGHAACRPYAEAIAFGTADINQCPPGGDEGVQDLAALLGVAPKPLDRRFGESKAASVVRIEEEHCIGCTLCIKACPVDAIVGAAKLMHTVIASACTGCELCIPPCPVDCIRIEAGPVRDRVARQAAAVDARRRFERRNRRLQEAAERDGRGANNRAIHVDGKKQEIVARAMKRARARLESRDVDDERSAPETVLDYAKIR